MENKETMRSVLPPKETVVKEAVTGIAELGKTAVKVAVEAMTEPLQIVAPKPQTHPSAEPDELAKLRAELTAMHEKEKAATKPIHLPSRDVPKPTPTPVAIPPIAA